ncbi:hypothetical protein ACIOC2_14390 [Streptomyces sp. NPDC088337]|uniref:hypothetical protein n=1 Tax=unclassified Streptomyces TaxID=2593676 RepID=UPI0038219974
MVPEQWRAAVVDDQGRVERIPYELCVLVSLRDALRRREIWVAGANRWRNWHPARAAPAKACSKRSSDVRSLPCRAVMNAPTSCG